MVLKLGGLLIVAQWPSNIYKQVLMAMQKQVAANLIYSFFLSLRGILSVFSIIDFITNNSCSFHLFCNNRDHDDILS
jgi:hypothetical protein